MNVFCYLAQGERPQFTLYPTLSMASRALQRRVQEGRHEVQVWFVRVIGASSTFSNLNDGGITADVPWCVLPVAHAIITIHHRKAFLSLLDDWREGGRAEIKVR